MHSLWLVADRAPKDERAGPKTKEPESIDTDQSVHSTKCIKYKKYKVQTFPNRAGPKVQTQCWCPRDVRRVVVVYFV